MGINRLYYLNKIIGFRKSTHIIVITGERRSGKSLIMKQVAKALMRKGVSKKVRK